ncbi:recombinase family protein (plasmid) [Streptomyces olivoreticuli]|uniref:recombinase family protein n=1 Tax=Streptomyces olivoreticuli TaxID=68246 RepID=UPI002657B1A0|nr:recombinase family protein [Streptomyces olivoreticuli]WKK27828.1 recombinase family protein [Streptomyces olivoreticuli]
MVDRLYLRHSTDKQTNLRQKHHLASYLSAGAPAYEDPATSSRLHPLKRPGFGQLLEEAAVGDVVRLADAARLFRSVKDVLDVRDILRRRGLHLRIASGAWAGMDLTSEDPMTKLFVTMLAGVLEFQRDMISENTRDGVAAARAEGKTLGRPARLSTQQSADIVTAYDGGTAVKALARRYGVDPKVIRRALDSAGARGTPDGLGALLDDVVDDGQDEEATPPVADPAVSVDVPGLAAEHLANVADEEVRQALAAGLTIRRGQGYSVRVTAPVSVHVAMVEHSATVLTQSPAGRKAHRIHSGRVERARS